MRREWKWLLALTACLGLLLPAAPHEAHGAGKTLVVGTGVDITTLASNGSPFWNFTSLRSVKVMVLPSGETFHFSARAGTIFISRLRASRPSNMLDATMASQREGWA